MPLDLIGGFLSDSSIKDNSISFGKHCPDIQIDKGFKNSRIRNLNTFPSNDAERTILMPKPSSHYNSRHTSGLRTYSSKLHLIDDTTLTSLPFPPPAATKRIKTANSFSSRFSKCSKSVTTVSQSLSPGNTLDNLETYLASSENQDTIADETICSFADETIEDTLDDSQDPIVLVEDYMAETSSKEAMFRKKSLANIKKRLREESSIQIYDPSLTDSAPCVFGPSNLISDSRGCSKGCENLEAVFGRIPGTDRLKHCTICFKPLYELSSIIGNADSINAPPSQSLIYTYSEFVCWDCISTYENILHEIHDLEAQYIAESIRRNSEQKEGFNMFGNEEMGQLHTKLCFKSGFETYSQTDLPKKMEFSSDLINRFRHLSAKSKPNAMDKSPASFYEWQHKLRLKLIHLISEAYI